MEINNFMGYEILCGVLNKLREEAPKEFKTYHPKDSDLDGINIALSKSFIHLYLKSIWGLSSFLDREYYITDGPEDGGIDAYFIDKENKTLYYIQSKFRMNKQNFESRTIMIEDLLNMEIDSILRGNTQYSSGVSFNKKIIKMIENISSIPDLCEYSHKIVILANIKPLSQQKLSKIFGNYEVEIFNYEKTYQVILLPLLTGTSYDTSKLRININTSDKNEDSRMEYSVGGGASKCKILLTFVPAIEVAKILHLNKNSILKYNPRCYLDFEGSPVNRDIYQTLMTGESNELALYNNGITLLADFAEFKKETLQKDKAILNLINPQIINGGQTAATILRIFRENKNNEAEKILSGKEILTKVISFSNDSLSTNLKKELIKKISDASNKQNLITYADRRSNDEVQLKIQKFLFNEFGLLYEKKRGEFFDGLMEGYIDKNKILDRNFFAKIVLACLGELSKSSFKDIYKKDKNYNRVFLCENTEIFSKGINILKEMNKFLKKELFYFGDSFAPAFLWAIYKKSEQSEKSDISKITSEILSQRQSFEEYVKTEHKGSKYFKTKKQKKGDQMIEEIFIRLDKYYKSYHVKGDLDIFFKLNKDTQ